QAGGLGETDPALGPTGVRQAGLLAERLAGVGVGAVLHGRRRRARETLRSSLDVWAVPAGSRISWTIARPSHPAAAGATTLPTVGTISTQYRRRSATRTALRLRPLDEAANRECQHHRAARTTIRRMVGPVRERH